MKTKELADSIRLYARVVLLTATFLWSVSLSAQSACTLRNQRAGGDDLWGVASGPGGLVAVGTNGAILQSTVGQVWTRRTSGTSDWLTAVTYGNGRYVAVGDHGRILSSTDGVVWTAVTQSATTQRLNNVVFALNDQVPFPHQPNEFVAVGEGGAIVYSFDAITWSAAVSGSSRWLRGLAFGATTEGGASWESCWVTTGEAGTMLLSSDGVTWASSSSGVNSDLEAVAFVASVHSHPIAGPGGGTLVYAAVGANGMADLLNFPVRDGVGSEVGSPASTLVSLNPAARFRCIVSGPPSIGRFGTSGSSGAVEIAAPVIALDETGNVFSLYDVTSDWSPQYRLSSPTLWLPEAPSLSVPMRAGVYVASAESFFFVGNAETIFQRDQVFSGRLGNISTRGQVGQNEKSLIAGFVVRGVTPKLVLVRGIGPALTNFGVSSVVAKPVLTVFDAAGNVVATNSGWGRNVDPAAISAAAARAGAFALSTNSDDAAMLLTLTPGLYTAQIVGAGGTSGVGLAEVYDLDDRVNGTSRAINLSTRGQVAGGENVLIAGLNVQGPAWRKFLVRGVGPSLANFGVANALPDPALDLSSSLVYPATLSISISRDPASVAAATNAVGAFALNAGSQDDILVATLPPANYTFRLSSKGNSTGVALIEIYEIGTAQ